MADANDYLVIGRIVDVYGLKGWVKVKSFTQPENNFLQYKQCFYKNGERWSSLEIERGKEHGKGLVVKFAGYDSCTAAETLSKLELSVKPDVLPVLDGDDFYWYQLEGLSVFAVSADTEHSLGVIDHLLETGSNDVLVIKPCEGSIDKRERLLPYRPEVVLKVDLAASRMLVDWDIEF